MYTTKLYFAKLTFRPEDTTGLVSDFKNKRRAFNKLLDSIATPKSAKTISLDEITPKVNSQFFHTHGDLTPAGFRQIWSSLSDAIEDMDKYGAQRAKTFAYNRPKKP